jgi:hypothetical protein
MLELLLASTALTVSAVDSPWQLVATDQATAAVTHQYTRATPTTISVHLCAASSEVTVLTL